MIRFGDEFDIDRISEVVGLKVRNEFGRIVGTVVSVEFETVATYNRLATYLVLDNGKKIDASYLGG